jgi:hypothetical protein
MKLLHETKDKMAKYTICIVMVFLLAACAPVSAASALANPGMAMPAQARPGQAEPQQSQATEQTQETGQVQEPPREIDPWLSSLWLDMSMGSQLVGLYNDYAGERDMARADHVSMVDLLDKVETGHRVVVFKNAADLEQLMPHLVGKFDIIGYNLESGPANRPDEKSDPVGSIQRVRAIADQYGMEVAYGPDRSFALSHGLEMAPYVDYFVLQVQRAQTDPQAVRDFVVPLAAQLRQANPDIQISVQIRTDGNVEDLKELLLSLKGTIDGVSILTDDQTSDFAKSLVSELRLPVEEAPAPLPSPTPGKSEASVAALTTPTPAMRRTVNPTPEPVEIPSPPAPSSSVRNFLLLMGLSIMGVIISGLVATVLIYSFRTTRSRKA